MPTYFWCVCAWHFRYSVATCLQRHFSPLLSSGIFMGWHVKNYSGLVLPRALSKPEMGFLDHLGEWVFDKSGAVLGVCLGHIEKKGLRLFWACHLLDWCVLSRTENECLLQEGCEPQFLRVCCVCSSSDPVTISFLQRCAEETKEAKAEGYSKKVSSRSCPKLIKAERVWKCRSCIPTEHLDQMIVCSASCRVSAV